MEREQFIPDLRKINWPDHVAPEQLTRMVILCSGKNTRVVVADEIEAEGLVMRGAVEQKFGTPEHPQWQMAQGYASIGQDVRQVDDSLGIWCRERGRENFTPVNTVKQRHLHSLIQDPRGLKLLDMLVLEKGGNPEISLSEAVGLTAGARRYRQLYESLIEVGVKPKELDERFYPPIAGGARQLLHRREPIPRDGEYTVVEEIVKDGVLIDEKGYYHVFWGKSHGYFQDIQDVLYQHDRVIEKLQGTMVRIGDNLGQFLKIEGEVAQAARFAERLSLISAGLRNASLLTTEARESILGQLGQLSDEIGQVRNELKRKGLLAVEIALSTTKPEKAGRKTQEAAGIFLQRASDAAAKLEGAIKREEMIVRKRDEWEQTIVDSFDVLGIYYIELQKRSEAKSLRRDWLGTMISQISSGRNNIFDALQGIKGEPYKRRMEQPEIKKLGQIPAAVEAGNLLLTKRILEEAFLILERVVKEKAERERAAKTTS